MKLNNSPKRIVDRIGLEILGELLVMHLFKVLLSRRLVFSLGLLGLSRIILSESRITSMNINRIIASFLGYLITTNL